MLHCGASAVEREAIEMAPTPDADGTWHPIPHGELLDVKELDLFRGRFVHTTCYQRETGR
jgi:hypothetical protein